MRAHIYSLYWDNIDPDIVAAQKAVWDKMEMPVNQHRIHGLDHGEWIDWTMHRVDNVDVFLFIDIDCIPLNREKVIENMQAASTGVLVGAEGAANHLDPNRSYAGAWYTYIDRKVWDRLGRPSAKATRQLDVCQAWTDAWIQNGEPVRLIPPTHSVTPKWDLPGCKLAYGMATTYGDDCFHLFESRSSSAHLFLDRCREIVRKG